MTKEKRTDTKKLARMFRALSNENRLSLFMEIMKSNEKGFSAESCQCFITDIMGNMKIGAPTVSHHMKELVNAGLVITEKQGKFLTARVNPDMLREALDFISMKG
jgi:DNA-binding transcriptional ArsR family regulator